MSLAALGSIWNGEQLGIDGYLIVQDADNKNEFFYLPKQYRLKSKSIQTQDENGNYTWENRQTLSHELTTLPSGEKYSVYNMKVVLSKMSKRNENRATMALRRKFGLNAKLKGQAPICGIESSIPNMSHHDPINETIGITYSLSSVAQCNQISIPNEFSIRVMVPMYHEPAFAKSLINGAGEIFPTIRTLHPYKYTDKVSLTFNAIDMYEHFGGSAGVKGTYKNVTAQVKGQLQRMIEKFNAMGSVRFDVQNQDPKVREYYHGVFINMLSKIFFKYLPQADATPLPGAPQISYGQNKSLIKASLALSRSEAERQGEIKLSLEDVNYGNISSQVPVSIPAISEDIIHAEIKELF